MVTRHGEAVALLISPQQAEATLLATDEGFGMMRLEAEAELAVGRTEILARGDSRGFELRTSSTASELLRGLRSRPRGMLVAELRRAIVGLAPHQSSPIVARSPLHIAGCLIYGAQRVALVYAIVTAREIRARLVGPQIDERQRRRTADRLMHGRWHP